MNKEKEREIKKIEETTYEKRKDGTMSIKEKNKFLSTHNSSGIIMGKERERREKFSFN